MQKAKLFYAKRLGKNVGPVECGFNFFDFDGTGLDLVPEMVPFDGKVMGCEAQWVTLDLQQWPGRLHCRCVWWTEVEKL